MSFGTSPISKVSQEIIDKIIDHVAGVIPRDWRGIVKKDIRHCALVSRSFRPRSEFYIFGALYVRDKGTARHKKLEKLAEIMDAHPAVADYFQELNLECVGSEYSWIGEDPVFLNLVQKMSRAQLPIRKLTLKADRFIDDGYGVLKLNENTFQPLRQHFIRPLILPHVTTLILDRLEDVPLEVVAGCVNLLDLELYSVKFVQTSSVAIPHTTRPALQRLVQNLSRPTSLCGHSLDRWDANLDFSQLRSLVVYKDTLPNLQFEQRIVDAAGESLQDLRITSATRLLCRKCDWFIDLGRSSCLHTLHVESFICEDGLGPLIRTLATIETSNSLHTISIEALVGISSPAEPEDLLKADWRSFSMEVSRVMGKRSFNITLRMVYVTEDNTDSDSSDEESAPAKDHQLNRRCESILSHLRTSSTFTQFIENPHCTVNLSHALLPGIH